MLVLAAQSAQLQHQPELLKLFAWRKCTQTLLSSDYRMEKEVLFALNTEGRGQKYTLHPHSGAVCSYFWLPPSFLRWMGWCGRLVVGCDFTEQTPARPCSTGSQEVFSTSSTPTFASQNTTAGLVLSTTAVLLDGPCVSEQNTTVPSPATLNPAIQTLLHPEAPWTTCTKRISPTLLSGCTRPALPSTTPWFPPTFPPLPRGCPGCLSPPTHTFLPSPLPFILLIQDILYC